MTGELIIGLDIGTTGLKTIVIDNKGCILYERTERQDLLSPNVGWAEEKPDVWWKNTIRILRDISSKFDKENIKAIGVSGMVPSLVLLDRKLKPIRNSIQQNDARTSEEIEYIRQKLDEDWIFEHTGTIISQQTIPPKLLWLKKHEKEHFERVEYILGSYDYINFKLTGILSLEQNWALESGMYDIKKKQWINDVLSISGISENILPEVRGSSEIIGIISDEVSELTGLGKHVKVIAGSGDHVASAFAAGVKESGDLLIKLGGAGDILICSDKLRYDKRLFIDYHLIPDKYLINGCMASSGTLVKWFTKECGCGKNYEDLDKVAEGIPSGSDGIIILPYLVGEKTPIFDPLARGVIFGLSTHHTKANIYRAILEAVGYGYKDHIEVMKDIGLNINKVFISNGGSKSKLWRKIITDIIGYPTYYIKKHPGSSLGVAFLAGFSMGIFTSWNEIDKFIASKELMKPNENDFQIYDKLFCIYKDIYSKLKEDFKRVNNAIRNPRRR